MRKGLIIGAVVIGAAVILLLICAHARRACHKAWERHGKCEPRRDYRGHGNNQSWQGTREFKGQHHGKFQGENRDFKSKRDEKEQPIKGSIAIPARKSMIAALAKINLSQAIEAALKDTPGAAIEAELENEDGYLVYAVEIATDKGTSEIKVDAGSGQILRRKTEDRGERNQQHGEVD